MDSTAPITSLCIVADPSRCPPNHELILKSYDRKEDCDLWREGGFLRASRITRYFCFSRFPQCSQETDEVLVDIAIQNEKELLPAGFRLIEKTNDSYDRAMRKKQISVKYAKLGTTLEAICDLVILTKSRRLPLHFTMIGELNGVLLGCKMCKTEHISSDSVYSVILDHTSPIVMSSPTHSNNSYSNINQYQPVNSHYENGVKTFDAQNLVLNDIPFQLHQKYADSQLEELHKFSRPISQIKSLLDIENEYYYSFQLEATVLQESPTS